MDTAARTAAQLPEIREQSERLGFDGARKREETVARTPRGTGDLVVRIRLVFLLPQSHRSEPEQPRRSKPGQA